MEISDRGLLYPILGLAAASAITASFLLVSGHYPDPISIANLYLFGLGFGLVVARVGRLGPFGGILGTPWQEAGIAEMLTRESARARQYGRELSVIAVKPIGKTGFDIRRTIRATDQLVVCRNGWNLVILPETDADSANLLMRKMFGGRPVLAAQTAFDASRPRQRLNDELRDLLRSAKRPEIISIGESKPRLSEAGCQESRALAS